MDILFGTLYRVEEFEILIIVNTMNSIDIQ